jgi:hypothetical protein
MHSSIKINRDEIKEMSRKKRIEKKSATFHPESIKSESSSSRSVGSARFSVNSLESPKS